MWLRFNYKVIPMYVILNLAYDMHLGDHTGITQYSKRGFQM